MDNSVLYDSAVETELSKHGVYASVTRGISMRPLFKTNRDMVILKRPTHELKKYDVVLYKNSAGRYVLHRIVKIRSDELLIRGDNTYALEHVKSDEILGVLTEFNRKGKRMSVDNLGYRVYSRVWNFIYPFRYLFVVAIRFAKKVYGKIFKRK